MTEEVQGTPAETQDTQAKTSNDVKTEITQEQPPKEAPDEQSSNVQEGEVVAEEVDYKSRYEKLEKETTARQDKINKQRAALSQGNNKIQELNTQLEALQVSQAATSKEPVVDDYETIEDYTNALGDFRADARVKDAQEKMLMEQKHAVEVEKQKVQTEQFNRVEADYRVNNPKYDTSKTELQNHLKAFPPKTAIADAIYEQGSREGGLAEIINYFGADDGARLPEFDRIVTLSPTEAAVEIYKIQKSLTNVIPIKSETKTKSTTVPVKVARGQSSNKSVSKMDGAQTLAWITS